jgi:predicted TPR repeat methyltransferase
MSTPIDLKNYFDKDYFESHNKSNYGSYCDFPFFRDVARFIYDTITPSSVLEFGCARGFIIKWLRRLGVDAHGVDISEYAISTSPEEVKPYLELGDITNYVPQRQYDLVLCLETIEHVEPIDSLKVAKCLYDCTREYCLISTPLTHKEGTNDNDKDNDHSHVNIHTKDYWVNIFKRVGFEVLFVKNLEVPRTNILDIGNTTPWLMCNTFFLKKQVYVPSQPSINSQTFKNKIK